jgi:hypothetical protein
MPSLLAPAEEQKNCRIDKLDKNFQLDFLKIATIFSNYSILLSHLLVLRLLQLTLNKSIARTPDHPLGMLRSRSMLHSRMRRWRLNRRAELLRLGEGRLTRLVILLLWLKLLLLIHLLLLL